MNASTISACLRAIFPTWFGLMRLATEYRANLLRLAPSNLLTLPSRASELVELAKAAHAVRIGPVAFGKIAERPRIAMTTIHYLRGDATSPQAKGNKIIAHVCNDIGGWGNGFVLAISRRWSQPEAEYRRWHRERSANDFGLGAVQLVAVESYLWVANMVGQRGTKTGSNGPPVRYEAIAKCLSRLAELARTHSASVHMPRIGCGLGGGKWEKIEPLLQTSLIDQGISVHVYDFD